MKREVDDLKEQLQKSETVVTNLQNTLHQKDSELMTLRSKVSHINVLIPTRKNANLHNDCLSIITLLPRMWNVKRSTSN